MKSEHSAALPWNTVLCVLALMTMNGCGAWPDRASRFLHKILHPSDEVIASIDGTPIFASDAKALYQTLPKRSQDYFSKNAAHLVNLTIDGFLWRNAALDAGGKASEVYWATLENAKNTASETWLTHVMNPPIFSMSKTEIDHYISAHPERFGETRSIFYRVDEYAGLPTKVPNRPKLKPLTSRQETTLYIPETKNPPLTESLAGMNLGQTTSIGPCNSPYCIYTIEDIRVNPARSAKEASEFAQNSLLEEKKLAWLQDYRSKKSIKIKKLRPKEIP
jgi:hypothetical protein